MYKVQAKTWTRDNGTGPAGREDDSPTKMPRWSSSVAQVGHDGGHLRNRLLAQELARAGLGEPPYPKGTKATYPGPAKALVAVHKNTNLVSQFPETRTPVSFGRHGTGRTIRVQVCRWLFAQKAINSKRTGALPCRS